MSSQNCSKISRNCSIYNERHLEINASSRKYVFTAFLKVIMFLDCLMWRCKEFHVRGARYSKAPWPSKL